MARKERAIGWWAALPLVSWLAAGCGASFERSPSAGAGGLTDGPTRWLMLPEEVRQAERLRTAREALEFIAAFWPRRDPDPATPGNEFEKTFNQRVEAADRLYAEEGGRRGSLTDCGRVLIRLGPPPIQRYSQKRVPAWEPGKPGARAPMRTRNLTLLIWVYPVKSLPPAMVKLLGGGNERAAPEEIALTFQVEPDGTHLIEGEKYLDMAVRAAIRE